MLVVIDLTNDDGVDKWEEDEFIPLNQLQKERKVAVDYQNLIRQFSSSTPEVTSSGRIPRRKTFKARNTRKKRKYTSYSKRRYAKTR